MPAKPKKNSSNKEQSAKQAVPTTPKELIQSAGRLLHQEFKALSAIPHHGERAIEGDTKLQEFLRGRLPRRFDAAPGFVLGPGGQISPQTDLIVFDALNSPVYYSGARSHMIPRDNTAAAIEIKSNLNRHELRDAAFKLAKIKAMRASPIGDLDKPGTYSNIVLQQPFTCVFAYDASTSLNSIAKNLEEVHGEIDSRHWLDLVVILTKGTLTFSSRFPESKEMFFYGGRESDDISPAPPLYVHLIKRPVGELAFNQFFLQLVAHITFFRQRTSFDYSELLGPDVPGSTLSHATFQFRIDGSLALSDGPQKVRPRFWLYQRGDRRFVGQLGFKKWQDGGIVVCSTTAKHYDAVSAAIEKATGIHPRLQRPDHLNQAFSRVLPLTPETFSKIARELRGSVFAVPEMPENSDPAPIYSGPLPP